jgi:cation diffusion facilitator CzcD-associated flavoprotein CzcO
MTSSKAGPSGARCDALRPETEETTSVVIIGGGPAGIAAAIALKQDLGHDGFTIYEKAQEGVGGVWRDNTYPGCGCDIPGHWYSLSRALNPDWGTYYPSQREVHAYWDALWARHGLRAHTRLGTEVVRATWDARAQQYTVLLEDVASKACRTISARVVLGATGGFQQPRVPEDLPGLETFLGDKWHSAAWRHDVPLSGKRVGVIGNGCSA